MISEDCANLHLHKNRKFNLKNTTISSKFVLISNERDLLKK